MKYINFKSNKFFAALKKINLKSYNYSLLLKFLDIRRVNFRKIYKYLDYRRFKLPSLKDIKFSNLQFFTLYLPLGFIFFGLIYLSIPYFFNYEKNYIKKIICTKNNIICDIEGSIKYSFFPTPRVNIKNLQIKDPFNKEKIFLKANNVVVKIQTNDLLKKNKQVYKKIEFIDYQTVINLDNIKKYKNFTYEEKNLLPINFFNGKIDFVSNGSRVFTLNNTDVDLISANNLKRVELKGKFLDKNIFFNFKSTDAVSEMVLKYPNFKFFTELKLSKKNKTEDGLIGNILIKKEKSKFAAIFDYKDNEIIFNKSNLRNAFLDGKAEGKISFSPFFNFDLDLNLNSLNFTKLYNRFLDLDESSRKKFFRTSNKINGKMNISVNKIYSKNSIINSLESRINYKNGNILVDQLLFNLGKLGAADLVGIINNEKSSSNFRFESNIFVDNKKKFLSKFGIYDYANTDIAPNMFISGNFDLTNLKCVIYEIANNKNLVKEDVDFFEKSFNESMLKKGYESLFNFFEFKKFIKLINEV